MKTHGLEPYIKGHPFFEGLSEDYIALIAGCARNVVFDPDEVAFRLGDKADEFYLIRNGRMAVEVYGQKAEPVTIQTVDDGDVLGWSWLFPPYRWQFDARALEVTRALALDGECLRGKCDADHDLGYELMKRFSALITERLTATRIQLLDLYGNP